MISRQRALGLIGAAAASAAIQVPARAAAPQASSKNINVVLAHGGWADGSSWDSVITPLQNHGLNVLAAPLPMTTLADDVNALARTIDRTEGPVVLVAHAYAGGVISSYASTRLKALVFITALAPDKNETIGDVFYREPPNPKAPKLVPDAHGLIWLPKVAFAQAFAPDAPPEEQWRLAAVQRPLNVACIQVRLNTPTWRNTPSWFFIAENDRMISVKTQRFMAERMNANVSSHPTDHAPLVTAPDEVVKIILAAANSPMRQMPSNAMMSGSMGDH
jgi:pimeloyl-ACP methyl ester carboxylesterase